jgi:peptidoglycan/LPS O-acetylase OafA/YrhL/lysophospholipase L1-like esterase
MFQICTLLWAAGFMEDTSVLSGGPDLESGSLARAVVLPSSDGDRDYRGTIALDQWRGLAMVMVLISHGFLFTGRSDGIGRVGVNLFFFISGVLVFRTLSRMRASGNWERSRRFWYRRFRRLYPALASYVVAMLGVTWLLQGLPELVPPADAGSYLKFMPVALLCGANYFDGPVSLGHLWSLACEIQFYSLAPIIYVLGGKAERRRSLVFGIFLVALLGLALAQLWLHTPKYQFQSVVWPMMLGFCAEYKRHWFEGLPSRMVTLFSGLGFLAGAVGVGLMVFRPGMKLFTIAAGALLLIPCWLAYLFGRPFAGAFGRGAKWVGERTYSLYLWQQPFTICGYLPGVLHPLGAAASIPVGAVWFNIFERPFLSTSRRQNILGAQEARSPLAARLWAGAGACLLAACLVAGFIWARYEARLRAQIWPTQTPNLSTWLGEPIPSDRVVLLFGDSRMAEWPAPRFAGWRVVNAGTKGLTTGQLALALPKLLREVHPTALVLEAGMNDLKYAGMRPRLAPSLVSLAHSNIVCMADAGLALGCKVIVLETWPAGKPSLARWLVWNQQVNQSVVRLNEQLRKRDAPQQGICVLDLFEQSGLNPEPELYRDTLHFKPTAYTRLGPPLQKELDTLAEQKPDR